jgi:outer membrane biosynthesis protein TonB
MHPLVRAFAISLAFHLCLFSFLEAGNRFDLWQFSPLTVLARVLHDVAKLPAALTDAQGKEQKRTEEAPELPLVFVDVDPSQAVAEAPEKTPFFSAFNSLAGNPDTSRDTGIPKFDGTQDKVLKTKDTPIPAPASQPPAPPPQPARPEPAAVQPPRPAPPPQPQGGPPPGDLAMAKPSLTPGPGAAPPSEAAAAPLERVRPRTLSEARAQQALSNQSALMGEKMKQDGGVKRFSVESSLDVRSTPYGNYYAKFVAAVQQCWYGLLDEQRYSLDRVGKVVLTFKLTLDGRVTETKVAESNVGDIYTMLCQLAVTKPAPYDKWPPDMRRMIGANQVDVRFTFYY